MSARDRKLKQRAKRRRKEHRQRIKQEKESSQIRKAEKAERNRRLQGQEAQISLPEDIFSFNVLNLPREANEEERTIFIDLNKRLFFNRLMNTAVLDTCDGELTKSKGMMVKMGFGKSRIEKTVEALQRHGGYCDCEIVNNVYIPAIEEDINSFEDEFYF